MLIFGLPSDFQDFAEEKRREEDRDKPQEVDTTLPGWVSPFPESFHSERRR